MRAVKVSKDELLKKVKANLETHVSDYNETIDLYHKKVAETLQENIKIIKKNLTEFSVTKDTKKFKHLLVIGTAPQCYEKEYKKAIAMLEMSVEDVIELEDDVFNQLVLDEWHWKDSFIATSSIYNAKFAS